MFGGEEVPDYDARLKFLSGFTGSAGIAVITLKKAILFTDGRYTLQARIQLNKFWEIKNNKKVSVFFLKKYLIYFQIPSLLLKN